LLKKFKINNKLSPPPNFLKQKVPTANGVVYITATQLRRYFFIQKNQPPPQTQIFCG